MESKRGQAGFSLVELLVAMVITVIVSGAIFGLLTGGQNAFRLQPELTDRQQNIRLAMALIEKDVSRGGTEMGAYSQVFTDGLDGVGPLGLAGNSDFLQVFGSSGECPATPISGVAGGNLNTQFAFPDCVPEPSMVLLIYPDGSTLWGFGWNIHGSGNGMLNFPPGQQPPGSQTTNPNLLCQGGCPAGTPPARVALLEIVRYEIALDPDGTPNLYRSTQGGFAAGAYVPAPGPAGGWQLVARGIEDLQVQYQVGVAPPLPACFGDPACPAGTPGVVVAATPATVVSRVMVTLSARSTAALLQGQSTNLNLGNAVRGQLTSVIAPRSSLLGIQSIAPTGWR